MHITHIHTYTHTLFSIHNTEFESVQLKSRLYNPIMPTLATCLLPLPLAVFTAVLQCLTKKYSKFEYVLYKFRQL